MNDVFQEFLTKQGAIYHKFTISQDETVKNGLGVDSVLSGKKGGYVITFKPAESILEYIASNSAELRVLSNCVVYPRDTLHTTLSDYKMTDGFVPELFEEHTRITTSLNEVAEDARVFARAGQASCSYHLGFVFNSTALILRAVPNEGFFRTAEAVVLSAKKYGIELRLPWGAHVTIARFTGGSTLDASLVASLCERMNRQLIEDQLRFQSMRVGHFTASEQGFNVTWTKELPLIA